MEYRHPGFPSVKKSKILMSTTKVRLTIFWNASGVLNTEFLTEGVTVNSDRYCAALRSFKQHIRRIRPERNVFLFHHYNARPYCSAQMQNAMGRLKIKGSTISLQPRFGTFVLLVVLRIEGDVESSSKNFRFWNEGFSVLKGTSATDFRSVLSWTFLEVSSLLHLLWDIYHLNIKTLKMLRKFFIALLVAMVLSSCMFRTAEAGHKLKLKKIAKMLLLANALTGKKILFPLPLPLPIPIFQEHVKHVPYDDEAHFWLNGYVNKQNCHIWSEANPQVYVETPLHLEKLTVWCALWAGGIIGPYFFKNDEGQNVTVSGDRYRAMITNFFIPELNNHDVQELWFQQDGATCHTARAKIDLLKDTFGDRLISRFGPVNWPPRSCDLTPLDYFLWGYVKSLVYADKPQTLDHLEDNIHRVIADIRPQMLEKVIENWTSRLDYIRASHGSPMPEVIFKMAMDYGGGYDMGGGYGGGMGGGYGGGMGGGGGGYGGGMGGGYGGGMGGGGGYGGMKGGW
ncbi:putative DD41D transposase [Trichonephila clavipes]|nr:putative DD41D transposase [Trichonephila clavipes]